MGTTGRVLVHGGPEDLATLAELRLAEMELRWTRFRDDSELMRLNRANGRPVRVSPETFEIVALAVDAWRRTRGFFDPTGLAAIVRLGYDRDFAEVHASEHRAVAGPALSGCTGIVLDPLVHTIELPPGVTMDLGGIGKGHAADVVSRELLDAGATSVCVDLGGDVQCGGLGPYRGAWEVDCSGLAIAPDGTRLRLTAGGVATSTTRRRRWRASGLRVHHLIDPATGRPAARGVHTATVLAAETAWAEVLAKAALIAGPDAGVALLEDAAVDGVLALEDGTRRTTGGFDAWCVRSSAGTRSS